MYVVIGATGKVGSRVADRLLSAGKRVRVVSRSFDRLKGYMARGAEPFAGDAADPAFLTRAFSGAEAVFSMIPPNLSAVKLRKYQNTVSVAITKALTDTGVTHVVNLSSVGAQFASKTGPILGLHDHEKRLNRIRGLNVVHLRAAYFMENLLMDIDLGGRQTHPRRRVHGLGHVPHQTLKFLIEPGHRDRDEVKAGIGVLQYGQLCHKSLLS